MIVNGNEIEILAPAGNLDNLKTAVNSGADSVYFGLSSFNARRNADNFSTLEKVKEAVDYCHLRGVRAHVTLNTIVYDEEIDEVYKTVKMIDDAGFDAVIVQDPGIVKILREVSDIPLHASTQMSAHSVSDAKKLKEMGFKRVVLAREMSLEEIKRVLEAVDIETEIFVHGALCMSVSGQCYFSSALGERSGNRGLCAGVCRLPFHVKDKDRFALSLKDNSVIEYIDTFAKMGITSLKIEGRMKNSAYVRTIVEETVKMGKTGSYDRNLLEQAFSRDGFTDGYIKGNRINMFGIRKESDKESTRKITEQIEKRKTAEKKIPVEIAYEAKKGENFLVTANGPFGSVSAGSDAVQEARKKPMEREDIERNLLKFGASAYTPKVAGAEVEEGIFLPVSSINKARRDLVANLDEMILEGYERHETRPLSKLKPHRFKGKKEKRAMIYDTGVLDDGIYDMFDTVFIPLAGLEEADPSLIKRHRENTGVMIPRVFFEKEDVLENELANARKAGISKAMAHTFGRVMMADRMGFDVYAGFGMNIANSYAVRMLEEETENLRDVTLSFENTYARINRISSNTQLSAVIYGRLPLMITRNCPVREETSCLECKKNSVLIDRKGERFPVTCSCGTSEILNSHPLCVFERDGRLKESIGRYFLFTKESRKEIDGIMKKYEARENMKGTTRGCYFRKLD